MNYDHSLRRAQHFMLTAAISALASAGLTIGMTRSALAEFEIQKSQVEKGEVELEYRGAVHWGFPGDAKGAEEGALEEEEEGDFPRQSHDFELQYGMTERWLFSTTLSADEPLDADFNVSSVELGLRIRVSPA